MTEAFRHRLLSPALATTLALFVAAGVAGSVLLFREVSRPDLSAPAAVGGDGTPQRASPSRADVEPAPAAPRIRYAPCRRPAVLERGVCVTDIVRTVVVPPPAVAPAAPDRRAGRGSAGRPTTQAAGGSASGDRGRDGSEDEHGQHGRDDDREHEDRDDEDREHGRDSDDAGHEDGSDD